MTFLADKGSEWWVGGHDNDIGKLLRMFRGPEHEEQGVGIVTTYLIWKLEIRSSNPAMGAKSYFGQKNALLVVRSQTGENRDRAMYGV